MAQSGKWSSGLTQRLVSSAVDRFRNECGQALVVVLVLMAVGGLMLPPLLGLVSTSLKLEEVHITSLMEFYAADAGVEDAVWQIKLDQLETLFPDYDRYAFSEGGTLRYWYSDYPGTASTRSVNGKDVDVGFENVWIPQGLAAPSPSEAQQVIDHARLIVTGGMTDADTYRIRLTYNYDDVADPGGQDLTVDLVGIWLPPGFTYVADSSTLEGDPFADYYCVPSVSAYRSGHAIIWDFSPDLHFTDLPGVQPSNYPLMATISFNFVSSGEIAPDAAVAWLTTSGVSGVDYAWDADVRVFKLTSVATDPATGTSTTVESYTARSEMRRLSSAIAGNYFATGNSLIGGNRYYPDNYHWQLYNSTGATISTSDDESSGIPSGSTIEAAYLYWTGWIDWNTYGSPAGESQTRYPSGDISRSGDWYPTSQMHSRVDEPGAHDGDSTYLRHGYTSGHVLFSFPAFDVPANNHIQGLTVSLVARDEPYTWGGNSMQPAIRVGGQNYLTTSTSTEVPYSYGTISYTYTTNPRTGQPWTVNEINGIGTNALQGFGVRSADANPRIRLTQVYAVVTCSGASLEYPANPNVENIATLVEDTARVNKALFNDTPVTADAYQVLYPDQFDGTVYEGTWFYTVKADVTGLLEQWIQSGSIESNGAGSYTFGHYYVGTSPGMDNYRVNAENPSYSEDFSGGGETGYPLGTPSPYYPPSVRYTAAHAGWSLLVIYSNPQTLRHHLYLYDIQNPDFKFFFGWHNNADFDNDGLEGGIVSGFLVPDQISGETVAGRITAFVGEGDAGYTGDYFRVKGVNLSNSSSPPDNVWNSDSPGLTVPGVDIDTFLISWASGILEPGDSSVQVDMPTETDGFTMTYLLLAFRSDVTSGGTLSFVISG